MLRVLFFLFFIVLHVSAQHNFKPSIKCYMIYNHEETRSQTLNMVLDYTYYQSEINPLATKEGELCSKVGCACFSYQTVCPYESPGSNHYSQCTDDDRRNGIVKWHRGWTSINQCEQMRNDAQIYLNLTCCYTDRCNDQPGKITKFVDSHFPIQQYHPYLHQTPQALLISHKPSQPHIDHITHHPTTTRLPETYKPSQTHNNHIIHHPTTTHLPETYKPSLAYDKALPLNNSLSFNTFSSWLIFIALVFCHFIIV